jgi:hypothetical protein
MAYDQDKMLEIFGTEELLKLFNELEPELTDVIVNQSFRKSARILVNKINANAAALNLSDKSGHRFKLSTSAASSLKKETRSITIGTKKKLGGYLAPIFDSGTEQRFTKAGRPTGRIKKTDFFANAVEDTQQEIKDFIGEDLNNRLNKLIRKRNKLGK